MEELISIVIPMYFEESVAEECYRRLVSVLKDNNINYEIVFVNDGSKDRTLEILKLIADRDPCARIISFSRNFGHQAAVSAGIDKAVGNAIIVIDADLQDPPELIPDMLKLWKNGYDVVYAKRKTREGESLFKLLSAKVFYRILNKMTNVVIPVDTGDFRLIDRKVAEVFRQMPEKNRFIRGMISWLGFKQIPIEYERKERFAGTTKYPLKKMIKFACDGILSFSSKPLKLIEHMGFAAVAAAFCTVLFSITGKLFKLDHLNYGWISTIIIILFLGGVQLLSVGVLGEYISRIHDESLKRPLYIIEEELNSPAIAEASQDIAEYREGIRKIV